MLLGRKSEYQQHFMPIICNHCGGQVLPKSGDICPDCRKTIDAKRSKSEGEAPRAKRAAAASEAPSWSFRDAVARRSKGGIFLGVALAACGFFGGSYQHRGAGNTSSGMDLVGIGIAVTVIAVILYLVCRRKSSD